jgi:TonB family protein
MRRVTAGLALALMASGFLFSGVAYAADASGPVWEKAPDRSDWARAYPAEAAQSGISGDVKMRCSASAAGLLQNCAIISETPTGQGFGAAALSLASGMELKPTTDNGKPVAGMSFIVPVKFEAGVLKGQAIITQPDWVRVPTGDELYNYWPAGATADGGKTVVHCSVTNRGLMQDCTLTRESPEGHGYGASALAVTELFVMRPMTIDGQPVGGGTINIPINFAPGGAIPRSEVASTFKVSSSAPWIAAPTAVEISAAYPKSLVGKVASGHVVMRCAITSRGALVNCSSISELPSGHGFVHAADTLLKDFRLPPALRKGDSYDSFRVDVPFDFRDPSQAAPPVEIRDPVWIRQIDPKGVTELFPAAAIKAGYKVGRATVACTVAADGTLTPCSTVTEEPAGYGFGDAAMTVASVMQMSPWTKQGAPVEGAKIDLPIKFVLPPDAPAAVPAQSTPAPK